MEGCSCGVWHDSIVSVGAKKRRFVFEVAYAITTWYSVPAASAAVAPSSAQRPGLIGQPRGAGGGDGAPLPPNTSNWLAYTNRSFPLKCILIVITYNRLRLRRYTWRFANLFTLISEKYFVTKIKCRLTLVYDASNLTASFRIVIRLKIVILQKSSCFLLQLYMYGPIPAEHSWLVDST